VPKFFRLLARPVCRRRAHQPYRFVRLHCEELENRTLLSASSLMAGPMLHALPLRGGHGGYVTYAPSQILSDYGFNNSVAVNVNGTATNVNLTGQGQTIAVVDSYDDPNIIGDLQAFDSRYSGSGLSNFGSYLVQGTPVGQQPGNGPSFSKVAVAPGSVSSTGALASTLPAPDVGWSLEISLDVQWAHAIAPGANLLLVEAASASNSDLLAAVGYAKQQPGVSVVSMSWGESEFATEGTYDSTFTAPGVTFVASSGDSGGRFGPSWPAISPNVLAVGGTQLTINNAGGIASETAWSGSGGGLSAYEAKPAYQNLGSVSDPTGARGNPDVAYNASSSTTYAVYDTYGQSGLVSVYGTSAGAPQWAALVARADQGRSLQGQTSLANAQAAVYTLNASAFHDITSGSNGAYSAKTGFDLVTGLGSPKANVVISGLIAAASSSSTTASSSAPTNSTSGASRSHHSPSGILAGIGDSAGFQSYVTLAQTPTTSNAAGAAVVPISQGNAALATTLLSLGKDNKLNFDPVGSHLQSDATDGGGGVWMPRGADPGPPDNDNVPDEE
jgi:subtilase family serine protease